MHFKWKYDPPTPEQKKDAEKLIDNLKVSPVIATIMAKRGIKEEDAKKFSFCAAYNIANTKGWTMEKA